MSERDQACPRCDGSGQSTWHQPGGGRVPVRCGMCRGVGKVDPKTAAREAKRPRMEITQKTP